MISAGNVTPELLMHSFIEQYQHLNSRDIHRYRERALEEAAQNPPKGLDHPGRYNAHSHALHYNPALQRLNSGDCGTASIAVGWVYSQLTGETVEYYDNNLHGYIKVGDAFYDTLAPQGVPSHADVFCGGDSHTPVDNANLANQIHAFLRADPVGQSFVDAFCELWGVPKIDFNAELDSLNENTETEE